jgi:hypothetical protein
MVLNLRAQLAACHIAEKQFAELVARHGPAQIGSTSRPSTIPGLTRVALRDLPTASGAEDWIDDDGVDVGKPIRLFVTIRKQGDHGRRLTGTNPAVRGAINHAVYTSRRPYTGIRSVLPNNIPNNEGVFRAIEVICPPGTVGNGVLPAACAARGLTASVRSTVRGALAMMLPDKVKAAGDGGNSGIIGGYDADRGPFVYVEFTCGAWGTPLGRWPQRQLAHVCQPVMPLRRDHRGRAAGLRARLRVRVRQGGAGVPRRRALPAPILAPDETSDDVRALRPQDASAVRFWRPGLPSENYLNPKPRTGPCRPK